MRYQINIIQYDADLTSIRQACQNLLLPQQTNEADQETNAVYVDSADVSEAVKRINALGYSTDEDND